MGKSVVRMVSWQDLVGKREELKKKGKPITTRVYAFCQIRLAAIEGQKKSPWQKPFHWELPSSQEYMNFYDIEGLEPGEKYEYRVMVAETNSPNEYLKQGLNWKNATRSGFRAYKNFFGMGEKDITFLVMSCIYAGPVQRVIQGVDTLIPGWIETLAQSFYNALKKNGINPFTLTVFNKGQTNPFRIFDEILSYRKEKGIEIDVITLLGDLSYNDWLEVYAGAQNKVETFKLLQKVLQSPLRHLIRSAQTTITPDDHDSWKNDFTLEDIEKFQQAIAERRKKGEKLTSKQQFFLDALKIGRLLQMGQSYFNPQEFETFKTWGTTTFQGGIPGFIMDTRLEAHPKRGKISPAQLGAYRQFMEHYGSQPKVITTQVPLAPLQPKDQIWDKPGYKETLQAMLQAMVGRHNTFVFSGDTHEHTICDVVLANQTTETTVNGLPIATGTKMLTVNMKDILFVQVVGSPGHSPYFLGNPGYAPEKSLGTINGKEARVVRFAGDGRKGFGFQRNGAATVIFGKGGKSVDMTLLATNPNLKVGHEVLVSRKYMLASWETLTKE